LHVGNQSNSDTTLKVKNWSLESL